MLSHELRTPLNSILGWARLLRDGQTPLKQRERALLSIERNAQHQTRLIEDLLDVSRIVSGKLTLEVQRVDLATVIDAALDLVRAAAESAAVEIVLDLHPSTPAIIGDPARLQQIVLNLIANAVKYTQRGGRVEIGLHRRTHRSSWSCETRASASAPTSCRIYSIDSDKTKRARGPRAASASA